MPQLRTLTDSQAQFKPVVWWQRSRPDGQGWMVEQKMGWRQSGKHEGWRGAGGRHSKAPGAGWDNVRPEVSPSWTQGGSSRLLAAGSCSPQLGQTGRKGVTEQRYNNVLGNRRFLRISRTRQWQEGTHCYFRPAGSLECWFRHPGQRASRLPALRDVYKQWSACLLQHLHGKRSIADRAKSRRGPEETDGFSRLQRAVSGTLEPHRPAVSQETHKGVRLENARYLAGRYGKEGALKVSDE